MLRHPGLIWWMASLGFHAMLLGVIFYLLPDRVVDLQADHSAGKISAGRAEQVIRQIRQTQTQSLSSSLKQLVEIRKKIVQLEQNKLDQYQDYAREIIQSAPTRLIELQQSAESVLVEQITCLESARLAASRYVKFRTSADFEVVNRAYDKSRELNVRLISIQQRMLEIISLDKKYSLAEEAQSQAVKAQEAAEQSLIDADTARDPSRASRQWTTHEKEIDSASSQLRRLKNDVLVLPEEIKTLEQSVIKSQSAVKDMESSSRPDDVPATQPGNRRNAPQTTLDKATRTLQADRKRLADAQKRLADLPRRIDETQIKLEKLLAEPDPQPSSPTTADETFLTLADKVLQQQKQVQQLQKDANAAMKRVDSAAPSQANQVLLQLVKTTMQTSPIDVELDEADLSGIYRSAVENEKTLTETYRRLRAIELSMTRRIPLSQASKLVEVARVVRPDLTMGLSLSVTSGADVPAARQAIEDAKAQMNAMLQLAQSLLAESQSLDPSQGTTISMDEMNLRYDQMQQMESLASGNESNWATDLTGFMGDGDGSGAGAGGFEGGSGELGSGAGGAGPSGGKGAGGSGIGTGGNGAGNGSSGGLPGGVGGPWGGGAGTTPLAEATGRGKVSFPGRRFATSGKSPDWVFIDSWYILGPFDNPGRANIDRQYPPETIIDLNATYPGKRNVPIKWEFYQSGSPGIMPPLDRYNSTVRQPGLTPRDNYFSNIQWIIYYAYSELYFETDCDIWVAIGSDDYSKVWINDHLVWSSGKKLKGWRVDEGLRKVHFNKGVNRVLYRVENGNNITQFSMVLCLKP